MPKKICFIPDFDYNGQLKLTKKSLAPLQYMQGALLHIVKQKKLWYINQVPYVRKKNNDKNKEITRYNSKRKLWTNSLRQIISAMKTSPETNYLIWGLRLGLLYSLLSYFHKKKNNKCYLILFRIIPYNNLQANLYFRLKYWLLRNLICRCDFIVVVSTKQVKEFSKSLIISEKRIKFLKIGIDTKFFSDNRKKTNKKSNHDQNKITLLFHGDADRDYKKATEILSEIRNNVKLIKTGIDPKEMRQFKIVFPESEIFLNCDFLTLRNILIKADVVIIPTNRKDYYTAGLTSLLEALAINKSVILTDDYYLNDYTTNNSNIYIIKNKISYNDLLNLIKTNKESYENFQKEMNLKALGNRLIKLIDH